MGVRNRSPILIAPGRGSGNVSRFKGGDERPDDPSIKQDRGTDPDRLDERAVGIQIVRG